MQVGDVLVCMGLAIASTLFPERMSAYGIWVLIWIVLKITA